MHRSKSNSTKKNVVVFNIILLAIWAAALPVVTYINPHIRESLIWASPIGGVILSAPLIFKYNFKSLNYFLGALAKIVIICGIGVIWLIAYLIATYNSVV